MALNGLTSHDGWALAARRYVFRFSEIPEAITSCANDLADFVADVGLPWFERFASPASVLKTDGPLREDAQNRLRDALAGAGEPAVTAASRAQLGLSA